MQEFHYQVPWRTHNAMPGWHNSTQTGGEHEFYGHMPLMSRPEAHNIDIHASLLDPFQQYQVRTFRQRSMIHVVVIADLSASMAYPGKIQTLADFTDKASYSAYQVGDYFSFYGCDETLRDEFYLPSRWYKGGVTDFTSDLSLFRPSGQNCLSILQLYEHLPRHKSLVFFVSDFHFPIEDIQAMFASLIKHDVIPVVLWDESEFESLPDWGLLRLYDAEAGRDRHLFMRPTLKQKIKLNFLSRREQLKQLFSQFGRQPFFIQGALETDLLTRYFYEF